MNRVCCELCGKDGGADHGRWGQLLGPISMGRNPDHAVFVHRLCALWSSEVGELWCGDDV